MGAMSQRMGCAIAVAVAASVLAPYASSGPSLASPATLRSSSIDGSEETFSIAVLPDTQHLAYRSPDVFYAQTQWLADNKEAKDIVAVLHEGDVVEDVGCDSQWQTASDAMAVLQVPTVVAAGNHDLIEYPGDGCLDLTESRYVGSSKFDSHFPLSRWSHLADGSGSFSGQSDNSYLLTSAGGMDLVLMTLTFGPSDAVLDWANGVAAQHRDRTIIVVTHDYIGDDDQLRGSRDCADCPPEHALPNGPGGTPMPWANTGQQMWEKFVRPNHNVRMVLNGHVVACEERVGDRTISTAPCDWTIGFRKDVRPDGSSVWSMLANFQNSADTGYLRLLTFNTTSGDVEVTTYSPSLGNYLTSDEHAFTIPSAAEVRTFTDVGYQHPFFEEIEAAAAVGLVDGHADGSFRPSEELTRQAAAAILWRAQEGQQIEGTCTEQGVTSPYTDVSDSNPFCYAIYGMTQHGLITGWPDGTFRPTNSVSRQAYVAFMFGRGTHSGCAPFTDVDESNPFCSAIDQAKSSGVSTGWPDGTFRPTLPILRDAAAAMAVRYAALNEAA
ncbi:MAG TPA: S-layer homology domain-containing protein [Acidimicrobiales bacterium]